MDTNHAASSDVRSGQTPGTVPNGMRGDMRDGTSRPLLTVLYYSSMVFVAAVVVQFYLAGAGIFRVTGPVHDATSLDPHRLLGNILAVLALLLLVVTLIARPNRRMVGTSIALFVLTAGEGFLAGTGDSLPYLAAFHLVVAAAILGAGINLLMSARRGIIGR